MSRACPAASARPSPANGACRCTSNPRTAGERSQYLLDFGFTPEVLNRNFDLLGIAPEKLDGLILSHSHRDHYGGLVGFVDRYRPGMRDDVKLYTGAGNLTFREKWTGARGGDPVPMGALDGQALAAEHVETVCCDHAHALAGPFTSGPIAWQSFEKVTPTTLVEPTPLDHFTEAERRGKLVLDKHPDEHATCYVVQGRGLVVISSCGHCGVINTVKTAQAVSGVEKVHAVIGGFHLGAAPADYIEHTVAELKALDARRRRADALHRPAVSSTRRCARCRTRWCSRAPAAGSPSACERCGSSTRASGRAAAARADPTRRSWRRSCRRRGAGHRRSRCTGWAPARRSPTSTAISNSSIPAKSSTTG